MAPDATTDARKRKVIFFSFFFLADEQLIQTLTLEAHVNIKIEVYAAEVKTIERGREEQKVCPHLVICCWEFRGQCRAQHGMMVSWPSRVGGRVLRRPVMMGYIFCLPSLSPIKPSRKCKSSSVG